MAVIGTGVDLVEVARIAHLLERHGARFKDRTYTAEEQAYCEACAEPAMHYAARFAAKEAVVKALGTGFAEGVSWAEVEVTRTPSGCPGVRLHGAAEARAGVMGICHWHLSLSHTREQAVAFVVAESR
ncbi:MAG: holo-ACP synthase [Verrucomicrobiales bacterium]|nr:holo-ACP synthase [Verrucomicrobiales bacterium]